MGNWTRQPPPGTPIDWDNPLTDDLRFLYCGNALVDVVGGRKFYPLGTQYSSRAGSEGITTSWGGAGSAYVARDAGLEPPVASWAAYTKTPGAIGNYARPFGKTYNNGTAAPYVSYDFEWNPSDGNPDSVQATSTSGGSATATPLVVIPTGSKTICVATNSGSLLSLYVNGLLRESTSMAGPIAYDTSATGNLVISGSNAATASNEWIGDLYLAALWGRVLTPADVWNFSDNPWQLFWMRRRTYSLANTSTGVVLSGAIVEQPDAVAGTTTLTVSASGAMTEGADASAGTLTATVTASGAITDQPDAMTGLVSGGYTLSGAIVEGSDISAGAVAASVSTSGAMVEAPDAVSGRIGASVSASGAMVEGVDAITGLISTATVVTLTGAVVDAPDAVSGAVSASVSVSGSVVESADTARGSAAFAVSAAAAIFEGADIASGTLGGSISASGSIVEGGDQASGLIFLGVAQEAACTLGPVTQNQSTVQVTVNLSTLGPVAQNQSTLQVIS